MEWINHIVESICQGPNLIMQELNKAGHSTKSIIIFCMLFISKIAELSHRSQVSCSVEGPRAENDLIANGSAHDQYHDYDHQRHQKTHHKHHSSSYAMLEQPVASSSSNRSKQAQLKFTEIRQTRNKCLGAERELDRCSAQLIGLGQSSGSMYPDSMQELDSVYCPKFRETVSCIKNSTDCYKPFERQIINWILTSTRKINYKRCKNENEKIRFLKLTNSCFSSMRNPIDECMGHYIGSLDAIAEYNRDLERLSEDDFQIQLSCCANRRFKQCIMNSAKQKCQSHDGLRKLRRTNSNSSQRVARKQMLRVVQDTMEDLKSTLEEMALTGPEFICKNIDEKFCKAKFDDRYTNRLSRHESIVPAILKIYANK